MCYIPWHLYPITNLNRWVMIMEIFAICCLSILGLILIFFLMFFIMPKRIQCKICSGIKNYFTKHKKLGEVVRFLIIGGTATIIDFLVTGLTEYIIDRNQFESFIDVFINSPNLSTSTVILGSAIGFTVGLIFNYVFSILFVYEDLGNSQTVKGFLLFLFLSIAGLIINLIGLYMLYDLLKINQWIAKIVMTILVLIYNYLSRKYFIFKKQKDKI